MAEAVVEPVPSKLGTRAYWDTVYARERRNFAENAEDEGEVWFGTESEDKLLEYLSKHYEDLEDEPLTVLDLGTGNGHLLFTLHEEGYGAWRMHGIDYSEDSVELARAIAKKRSLDDKITFDVADFIKQDYKGSYDLVLDKGTYDAICLSDERLDDGRTLAEAYPGQVTKLLAGDAASQGEGTLLITSCNWTRDELLARMTEGGQLQLVGEVKRPSFSFGGKQGSTLATLAFRRRPVS
ncbi:Protein-lysine N-methyltransferase efm4 [Savitreella phatthalungensis]